MSVGAKTQKFLKNDPLNSNFCFLLHFYTTIFKSQWVQMHPLHPLLRGPCIFYIKKSPIPCEMMKANGTFFNILVLFLSSQSRTELIFSLVEYEIIFKK